MEATKHFKKVKKHLFVGQKSHDKIQGKNPVSPTSKHL